MEADDPDAALAPQLGAIEAVAEGRAEYGAEDEGAVREGRSMRVP
ncbi:hypothetical protein [Methylobacterium sp. J-030]|nr:hypothetical protein [Methylobacterium sp. J-030]